ncbi:MAG: hypothetical protein KF708_24885, partial [Pirellulales bacterium]|nr:hypothetical protein [Pirellulales bacterium]
GLTPAQLAWTRFLNVLDAISSAWLVPGGADRCNRFAEQARNLIMKLAEENSKFGIDPKEFYDNEFFRFELSKSLDLRQIVAVREISQVVLT